MAQIAKAGTSSRKGSSDFNHLQRPTLRNLRLILEQSGEMWRKELEHFARKYGAIGEEIPRGINNLIAQLLQMSSAQESVTPLTKKDFIRAFTGYEDAEPLVFATIAAKNSHEIMQFPLLSGSISLLHDPVRRRFTNEMMQAINQHALIVLHGDGGCGKSVAVWHLAQDLNAVPLDTMELCATLLSAKRIQKSYLSHLIYKWRNMDGDAPRSEKPQMSLKRLQKANLPLKRPILFLGLDAIDESIVQEEQRLAIEELLIWFWEQEQSISLGVPPLATLIITCRTQEREDINSWSINSWLGAKTGFNDIRMEPYQIRVSDFTSEELLQAAYYGMPAEASRFEAAFRLYNAESNSYSGNHSTLITLQMGQSPISPIASYTFEILKHPILWRALLDLDSNQRQQVLEGNESGMKQLASAFIKWFCTKAQQRGQRMTEKGIQWTLQEVAKSCLDLNCDRFAITDWLKPICNGHMLSYEARVFFEEAASAGLIVKQSGDQDNQWTWRHDFIWKFLAGI